MTKLGAVIQVPFRSGNQFLGEGGLQVSTTVNPDEVVLKQLVVGRLL